MSTVITVIKSFIESKRPNPCESGRFQKVRETRLFFGFGQESIEFAIDAIHRLNQTIQDAIERGLVQTFSVSLRSLAQSLKPLLVFVYSFHHLNSRPRMQRLSSMPLPTGNNTDWMSVFARTCLRYSAASARENSGNNMLSATIIAPDPSFG